MKRKFLIYSDKKFYIMCMLNVVKIKSVFCKNCDPVLFVLNCFDKSINVFKIILEG